VRPLARLAALGLVLMLAACGGGGGGGSSASQTPPSNPTPPTPPVSPPMQAAMNVATITVDGGPSSITSGPNGVTEFNQAYVSVTLCAPGSATCQTIDHVQVDTGSVGLRIVASALNASLLSALPRQTDPGGNPVGECLGFVDGFVFGSVRSADFTIAGESVAGMPLQVIGDSGVFAQPPGTCSTGGGSNLNTVKALGANGIIGLGVTTTDCGSLCTMPGGFGAAIYYDCPASGCASIIARAASTSAPFQQLPNPVAALPVDNNGILVSLPAPSASGQASLSGSLILGIGTQSNNVLGTATILATTPSTSPDGAGFFSAVYKSQTLSQSFADTGSNLFLFVDPTITPCSDPNFSGFYCPAVALSLNATLQGTGPATAQVPFVIGNAKTLLSTSNSAVPGVGGTPSLFANPVSNSFDFGLPFFYGRNVFIAIEGRAAGGTTGPFIAF
jgi:hypothetical protein